MINSNIEKLFLTAILDKDSKKIEEYLGEIELWQLFYEIDGLSVINFLSKNKNEKDLILNARNLSEENFLFILMLPNQTEKEIFDNILKRKDLLSFNIFTFFSTKFKDLTWFKKFFNLCNDLNLEIIKDEENILSWVFSETEFDKTKLIMNFILDNTSLTLFDAIKSPIDELNYEQVNLILNIALERYKNSSSEILNLCDEIKKIKINNDALFILNNTLRIIKSQELLNEKLLHSRKNLKITI